MAIPSSTFTEIVTTTLNAYSPKLADNVELNNGLLTRLRKRGNTKPAPGGVKLLENLKYAANSTFKWFSGLEALDVGASDVLTSAAFDWKEANCNVVISHLEQAQNSGTKESVHNLVKARIEVAETTMRNNIGAALFYSNTESGGKAIGGLQHLIADLPTSGIVGGIDRASQTWWANQYYDFSTQTVTASSTTIQHAMNQVWVNTTRGSDMIDVFVAGATYFMYYLESLQANQRFTNDDTVSAGFRALKFMGGAADVIYDANCAATRMYGLNTNYISYRPHTDWNFVTLDEKASVNQAGLVIPLYWKGNMTVSNPSLQAVVCA